MSDCRRLLRTIAEEAKLLASVDDEEVKGQVRAAMLSSLVQYGVLVAVPLSPIFSVGVMVIVAALRDKFSTEPDVVQVLIAVGASLASFFPVMLFYLMLSRLRAALRDERESRHARDDT